MEELVTNVANVLWAWYRNRYGIEGSLDSTHLAIASSRLDEYIVPNSHCEPETVKIIQGTGEKFLSSSQWVTT